MPKDEEKNRNQEDQNILAEEQDNEEELEENVGVVPRKVSREEFINAEKNFKGMLEWEEQYPEIERTPFRPGKNTRFVLTDRQKDALSGGISEIGKYLKRERSLVSEEANQKLVELQGAMQKMLDVGLDGLNPADRKVIEGFDDVMNSKYRLTGKSLIENIAENRNPYELNMNKIYRGVNMLSVMTGIPSTYKTLRGYGAEDYKRVRAQSREENVKDFMSKNPNEVRDLVENADKLGLKKLQEQYKGTEIGEKLGQISTLVENLRDYKFQYHKLEDNLKEADGIGTFLNSKGANGKTNYDTIAEALLGKKQNSEKKQAFDLLLGQLNTVCDLDIGVPYAIEAVEEHKWNKDQQEEADSVRIDALNSRLHGNGKTVFANDYEFLESFQTLNLMVEKMIRGEEFERNSENSTKMYGAKIGFDKILTEIRRNSGLSKLDNTNEYLVHALDFGKTLHNKVGNSNETIYDRLVKAYQDSGKTKQDLDNTLEAMNKKLGMKIIIPGKQAEGGKDGIAPVEQHKPYLDKIKEVQRSSNRMDDPVQLKMALASVLALRRMSVDPAHKGHKKIRSKAAMAKAAAIMETEAFKSMTKDMDAATLAKKVWNPKNFDREFAQEFKRLDEAKYENLLKNPDYKNKLAESAKNAAASMDKTGTGVYMLGIKRGSNSGMYDRAVLAMQEAAENPDAATTMQSVQAVKEYLSNKMTVRKSPSGKTRWNDCMKFLHDAMPEQEFKEYCDQVNRVRGAKEGSSSYIKPSQFGPKAEKNAESAEPEKNKEIEGQSVGNPVTA